MTPELIGILAVGATLIGLLVTFRRDARADNQALRAEFRADNQRLRTELNAGLAEVRGGLDDVRKDVQALTERVSRLEGVIEGLFAPTRRPRPPRRRRLTPIPPSTPPPARTTNHPPGNARAARSHLA